MRRPTEQMAYTPLKLVSLKHDGTDGMPDTDGKGRWDRANGAHGLGLGLVTHFQQTEHV